MFSRSAPLAKRLEGRPARVALRLLVRVRLLVQVLPADAAEAGAVGPAEDLVRELERHRVARPLGDVEIRARDVLRRHLLVLRVLVLVLARPDRHLEHGVAHAPVARADEAGGEAEGEDRPGVRARDLERGRHPLGHRHVPLAAELERRQLDLELVAVLLARTELHLTQAEARHAVHGSVPAMTEEARLERVGSGLVPASDGWFVVNAREAAWVEREGFG